jgi:phosphopentomutase
MKTTPFDRILIIVLDSVGIGHAPDAKKFGDEGSNTIGHIHEAVGLNLPHLAHLGLSRISPVPGNGVVGAYGRMVEQSIGKDTLTGHFEIAGLQLDFGYPSYPDGFDSLLVANLEKHIGRKVLGNKVASGTAIIEELGPLHLQTGDIILYTSADSVFQVAAHVDCIPLTELYRICQIARELLVPPRNVARVIARPFRGDPKSGFERTLDRRDYALEPPALTVLDHLHAAGFQTHAIGKIGDIFTDRGITYSNRAKGNPACIDATIESMKQNFRGLIFTNLVDFDTLYGHRRDPEGYRDALQLFDAQLPRIMATMTPRDLLIITADHGCDPCFTGNDHTREMVPLLVHHQTIQSVDLGTRTTFADIGKTIDHNFDLNKVENGTSFLESTLPV